VVRIEATLSNGRGFGHAERGYNPATGEFQAMEIDLSQVPPESRIVTVGGRGIPLSDYMTMRIMRMLQVPASSLTRTRVVEVESVRSVLELDQAVRNGIPPDQAARNIQAVRYNERAITSAGGGQVLGARVEGGHRIPLADLLAKWEGSTPPADMVSRHNQILEHFRITREQAATHQVLSGFDIVLTIAPLNPVVPVPRTGNDPVVPVPRTDNGDGEQ
jgi:hypothetical protein